MAETLNSLFLSFFFNLIFIFNDGVEREGNIDLLFHFLMHSLVDSCMCPNWGLNLHLGVLGRCSNPLSYLARA